MVEAVVYIGQVVWFIHMTDLTTRLQTAGFSPADLQWSWLYR